MSRIEQLRRLVSEGLYYLTEHAWAAAEEESLTIWDIEHAIMTGKIRRTWPREAKHEVVGLTLDKDRLGIVCRITATGKVRIITIYRDRPR